MQTNNLKPFKAFLDDENSEIAQYVSSVQYSYDVDVMPYSEDPEGVIGRTNTVDIMTKALSSSFGGDYSTYFSTYGSMFSTMNVWQEMLPGESADELIHPLLRQQYDVLYGRWPDRYDEVVLIVDDNNEISDLVLYSLGLKPTSEIETTMGSIMNEEEMEVRQESWSYEDVCNKTFRYIYPADTFQFDEETGKYTDLTQEELALRTLYNNGEEIRIVGIIRKNSDSLSGMLSGAVGYTHALVEHIISMAEQKELVRRQRDEPEIDVFNGLPLLDRENEISVTDRKVNAAKQYIDEATVEQRAEMYVELISTPSDEYLNDMLDEQMEGTTREDIEKMILESYPEYASMLSKMDDNTLDSYLSQMISQQVKEQYAAQMADLYKELSDEELAEDFDLLPLEEDDYIWLYDNYMPPVYSTTTFKDNLKKLGYTDLDSPQALKIRTPLRTPSSTIMTVCPTRMKSPTPIWSRC